jgi:inositol oxygenase
VNSLNGAPVPKYSISISFIFSDSKSRVFTILGGVGLSSFNLHSHEDLFASFGEGDDPNSFHRSSSHHKARLAPISYDFPLLFIHHFITFCLLLLFFYWFYTHSISVLEMPGIPIQQNFNTERDGVALESISDEIDKINVLKDQARKLTNQTTAEDENFYHPSKFDSEKDKTQFRQYEEAKPEVKNFYLEQHTKQTVAYNLKARNDFRSKTRAEMTIWEAMEKLNTLIDDSDPDTSLTQIEHLLQAAEAMRKDGKPRWMQLTGLIHDLGKLLYFFDAQGQWDVVGDTFPVGCAFDDAIIYGNKSFQSNADYDNEIYSTKNGIYSPGCGLDNVMLSWGHDEYLYHIVKEQSTLPVEALAMIRYHSFYPWHSGGAYRDLMDSHDQKMLEAVKAFNPYDLYSKSDDVPKPEELKVCLILSINPNEHAR